MRKLLVVLLPLLILGVVAMSYAGDLLPRNVSDEYKLLTYEWPYNRIEERTILIPSFLPYFSYTSREKIGGEVWIIHFWPDKEKERSDTIFLYILVVYDTGDPIFLKVTTIGLNNFGHLYYEYNYKGEPTEIDENRFVNEMYRFTHQQTARRRLD